MLLALAACAKPRSEDPYWANSDKLFLVFFDVQYLPDDQKTLERLSRIRRDTALLKHPDWANTYSDLLVNYMQDGIGQLHFDQIIADTTKTMASIPGAAQEDVNKLMEKQRAVAEKDRQEVAKMLEDLNAERQRLGARPFPLPGMRRTPTGA